MADVDLCSLDDVRTLLELEDTETDRDGLIATLITPASRAIMRHPRVQREFAPMTENAARTFRVERGRSGPWVDLAPYDLRTADSVVLHPEESPSTTLVAGEYLLEPVEAFHGVYNRIRIAPSLSLGSTLYQNFGYAQLRITGDWGFAVIPDDVVQAAALTVASWIRRDVSSFNAPGEAGDGPQLRPTVGVGFAVPLDALRLLAPFGRWANS